MQLVARTAGGALGHEFRLEFAGRRIGRRLVEIDHAVEQARGADELVQRLALLVLLGKAMRRAGRVERGRRGRAVDADAGDFRAHPRHDLGHALAHSLRARVAVAAEIVDALEPDHRADARKCQHVTLDPRRGGGASGERLLRRILRRTHHLVAADAGVDHRGAVTGGGEPARQHVRPAVVAVHRRGGAVGDRVAERDDHFRIGIRHHVDRVEEEPRGGGERKRRLVLGLTLGAAAWRGDVGRLQCLGVPGHRAGLAGDVEADRELAAGQRLDVLHERQRDAIAPGVLAGLDRDARLAAECDRLVRARRERGAAQLQPDIDAVEGDGLGAERVGETQPCLLAPHLRHDDQPERLVARAGLRCRKGEFLHRLRRRIADRVGALHRGGPAGHPFVGGMRGSGQQSRDDESGACSAGHGVSSVAACAAAWSR